MFFLSITKEQIAQQFQSGTVEELKSHSWFFTIVTDNFLSKYVSEPTGFSVIESPFPSTSSEDDAIFVKASYNSESSFIEVFKTTFSGRPVYYHINSKGEFFCSTHISLLRQAGVPIEENIVVVPEFFVYRFVMPPNTLYKHIYQLLAGGRLQVKMNDDCCLIRSFHRYAPPQFGTGTQSIEESSQHLYDYLSESLKKFDASKDELAMLLSGGIDSSILTMLCKNIFSLDTSYSTGYPFERPWLNDEKKYALTAADALGMHHHFYEPTIEEYLSGLVEAISFAEMPVHHLQSVLLHLLWKNGIPQEKSIVVSGQGAGSLFGYNHYFYFREHKDMMLSKALTATPTKGMFRLLSKIMGRGEELVDLLQNSSSEYQICDPSDPLWSWMEYGSKQWACSYFNVTEQDIIAQRCRLMEGYTNVSVYDLWSLYSLFGDEEMTLSIWSKIGEGNKKIVYFPFYEKRILDYVFSIPWSVKLQSPLNRLSKGIARYGKVPEFIITRPKSSFGIRSRSWAQPGGVFKPLVPLAAKVFDEKVIRSVQSRNSKNMLIFWNLINYALWKRLCIENEPVEAVLEEID